MSAKLPDTTLHLPDLTVRGFRGIEDLSIRRLGRVTLFVGKNGVGKTTLLDAVRIYAARGRISVLTDILRNREEFVETVEDDDDETLAPNWGALFHGRRASSGAGISISPINSQPQLRIETDTPNKKAAIIWRRRYPSDGDLKALKIEFQGAKQEIPMLVVQPRYTRRGLWENESQLPPQIPFESLGPSLLSNTDMARFWDKVALTDDENRAVYALNLVFGDRVERVAVVGDRRGSRSPYSGRRAVVKIRGQAHPVPLRSLGDGATRLFGVALALANSRDGFLVIDEAENGIHYSVQRDFWRMVLGTAQENNIQVLATTHSWDCAVGFAQAATEAEDVEGVLVRLEREDGQLRAIEYSEDNLEAAAEQGIEVR